MRASGRRPTTGYVPIVQTVLRVYSQIHIIPYIDIGRNEKNFDLIISVLGEHARATGVFSWPVPTRPLSPAAATRAGCC